MLAAILAGQDEQEAVRWSELSAQPWQPDGRGEFLERVRWWLSMYVPPADSEAYLAELIGTLAAGPAYYHAPAAVIAYDALGALTRLRAPTLFLSPVEDNLIEETRRAHAAAPGRRSRKSTPWYHRSATSRTRPSSSSSGTCSIGA